MAGRLKCRWGRSVGTRDQMAPDKLTTKEEKKKTLTASLTMNSSLTHTHTDTSRKTLKIAWPKWKHETDQVSSCTFKGPVLLLWGKKEELLWPLGSSFCLDNKFVQYNYKSYFGGKCLQGFCLLFYCKTVLWCWMVNGTLSWELPSFLCANQM